MAQPIILSSFSAGEFSPHLYARVDLQKYHAGAQTMRNFFVDYRGGASSRAGTQYVAKAWDWVNKVRLIRSAFNQQQQYVLELGNFYMRFIQNGAYILDSPGAGAGQGDFAVTGVTNANPAVLSTAGDPGVSWTGQEIFVRNVTGMPQINGRLFKATRTGAGTFSLQDLDGTPIDSTTWGVWTAGGLATRVYTINTPWAAADLPLLKFTQSNDVMTLTHPSYRAQVLRRFADNNWTIGTLSFSTSQPAPIGQAAVNNPAGSTTTYRYVITTLSADFKEESLASAPATVANALVMSTNAASFNTVSWTAVSGAGGYNVYRQREVPTNAPSTGDLYGFVGTTFNNGFVDHNIAPDFTLTPPQGNDPFSHGSIVSVPVTAGGAGYLAAPDTILNITDTTGNGAQLIAVIAAGVITGVNVFNGGFNYAAPSFAAATRVGSGASGTFQVAGGNVIAITVNVGGNGYAQNITWQFGTASGTWTVVNGVVTAGNIVVPASGLINGLYAWTSTPDIIQTNAGAGATFGAAVLTSVGNNPGVVTYWQSRQVFAGSNPNPDGIWASQTDDFFNMNYSFPTRDDDAIAVNLVSQEANVIKWLVPMNSLIVLTAKGAWKIEGSGGVNDTITPTNLVATPQSFSGAADVPPIVVNYDVLYVQAKGSMVRDLNYDFYTNVYTGRDISVIASHLFFGHTIVEWGYCEEPFKVIWAVRDDGVLLSLTYLKDQDMYAWARHDTQGLFTSVATVTEGIEDVAYFVVRRMINGKQVQFIERMVSRSWASDVTKVWAVDNGQRLPLTFPAANAFPNAGHTGLFANPVPTITGAVVITGGHGYSAGTICNVTDGTGQGVGAIATPTIVAGVITAVAMTGTLTGYKNPQVTFFDPAGTGVGAAAQITLQSILDIWADAAVFAGGNVGNTVRINGGRGVVLTAPTNQHITVAMLTPMTSFWPPAQGAWSMTAPVASVILSHLPNTQVTGLVDGNLIPATATDANGTLALPAAGTDITVGLGYQAQLLSLYLDTGASPTNLSKRSTVPAVTVQLVNSRGLKVGYDFDNVVEMKDRDANGDSAPAAGVATPLFTGPKRILIPPKYQYPGQVAVQQDYPLPATILGLIPEIQVGDS